MNNMPKYTMEMILEYAKVFPENADMGDPNGPRAAQAIHDKGGQYTVNAYFTSEDQIQELVDGGLDLHPMNSDRIKEGNKEFGIGKFITLKRPVPDNIKTFENKNGPVEVNYGGPVGVVNLTEGADNKRWWNLEEDGLIGNGSTAMVQFETYAQGAGVRLKNIGVTEHVTYETNNEPDEGDKLFDMGEVA
jgi:hypothetical protein